MKNELEEREKDLGWPTYEGIIKTIKKLLVTYGVKFTEKNRKYVKQLPPLQDIECSDGKQKINCSEKLRKSKKRSHRKSQIAEATPDKKVNQIYKVIKNLSNYNNSDTNVRNNKQNEKRHQAKRSKQV